MRHPIVFFVFVLLASCNSADKKPAEKKAESQHSKAFNQSFDEAMNNYYALSESFVNWDSASIQAKAQTLKASLQNLSLDDVKKDSASYTTASETLQNTMNAADETATGADMSFKRRSFNRLTQNIYDLLRVVKYDEKKLYLQVCGMAFNDTEEGLWLTDKGLDSIRNPYLGMHHPKYGSEMLVCGENKSTIDFQKK